MFFTRDRSYYRSLIALAIPIALQNAITFSVNFADNLMIGALGDTAISGVFVANQLQTFLQLFLVGIEGAVLILAAQYWGRQDTGAIRHILATAIRTALSVGMLAAVGAIFFPEAILRMFTGEEAVIEAGISYLRIVCFSYVFFCISQVLVAGMRSVESPKIGLFVSILALCVNVSLNYVLIFGKLGAPAMGIRGAALATLISRITEASAMMVYVRFRDRKLGFRAGDLLRSDPRLTRDFFRYGLPVMAGQAVWAVNMASQNAILGRFSQEVITAASITGMMHDMMYIAMTGLGSAVGIITGKTIGSGHVEKIREYSRTTQVLFLGLGLVSGLTVHCLRDPFIGLYNASPAAMAHARQMINVVSLTIIGSCYQSACLHGLVKSGGDTSFNLKNDSFFVFLVVLPLGLLASRLGAAPWVVFLCLKCDQFFKCIVAFVKINRYNWIKNLTRPVNRL